MSEAYKLEPYDIEKLKRMPKKKSVKGYTKRNIKAIVEEFADSNYDCCRIYVSKDNMDAHVVASNIRDAIRRCDYVNKIKVVIRHEEIFLVKKSAWED